MESGRVGEGERGEWGRGRVGMWAFESRFFYQTRRGLNWFNELVDNKKMKH